MILIVSHVDPSAPVLPSKLRERKVVLDVIEQLLVLFVIPHVNINALPE